MVKNTHKWIYKYTYAMNCWLRPKSQRCFQNLLDNTQERIYVCQALSFLYVIRIVFWFHRILFSVHLFYGVSFCFQVLLLRYLLPLVELISLVSLIHYWIYSSEPRNIHSKEFHLLKEFHIQKLYSFNQLLCL